MTTSRRLHFVVGTSLLGASLSLGCVPKPNEDLHVNPGPEDRGQPQPEPEPDNVNVGPVEEPPVEEPQPDGPQPDVNTGPIDEPAPTPKHVNTRPKPE